jgi:mannose/cellobiose epimerase-like protein (N-acyl-D-glucosamine 2-epimerase family)
VPDRHVATPPASFTDPAFLYDHARALLTFYYPHCLHTELGGYITYFDDDGSVFDAGTRHVVWQTRYLYNFALAARFHLLDGALEAAQHGLSFLMEAQRDRQHGGYFWVLEGVQPVDKRKLAYGHAFVLLAASEALLAQLDARPLLDDVGQVLQAHFWRPSDSLFVDEINDDWSAVDAYRGQNANMHLVEAHLEAFEATRESHFLDRAETVARRVVIDLAGQANGLVWEHYHEDWTVDWEYNRDKPRDLFRPYGYLSGHLMEWAKLLLMLERQRPSAWLLPAAQHLFATASQRAWDDRHGGFLYSFAPDGTIIDDDKYYWVMAEALAAAATLFARTGDRDYLEWYNRTWEWVWEYMVDHQHGGWYSLLSPGNGRKQPDFSRGKVDFYHQLSACIVIASAFEAKEDLQATRPPEM